MSGAAPLDLLAALGYAIFERNRKGGFRAFGQPPVWLSSMLDTSDQQWSLPDVFPFLEGFLPDAEEFWADPGEESVLRSDYWIQTDLEGNERHFRASAILFNQGSSPDRKLLSIENDERGFQDAQRLVHHAHETSLAYEKIAKLSRELERATTAKSEFLARMSHEIRTPMNAVIGMAELLLETPLNIEQRELVHVLQRAGDNLLSVVNDILDFSKVEAGQIELENIQFELNDVLERALEIIAIRAHAKGLEVSGRIAPGVPACFVGDPVRLRQVVLNLLSNAVKFTDRGEVTVMVSSDLDDLTSGTLHFVVSDTGIGIPADRISAIFDSFTQVDTSMTRRFGGTGLGLAISKRFVDLMGGRIWAESTLGLGTTMHFTAHFGVVEGVRTTPPEFVGRCLVVDDNANHRSATADILLGFGASVDESEEAGSAQDRIEKTSVPYDLLLLDAQLQTSDDGLALALRARDQKLARLVLLMLTTDRPADASWCREHGLGYLLKPVRRAALYEAMVEPARRETKPETVPMERPLRILLADDSEDNRFLVRGYLKGSNCILDEVENGLRAVERFKSETYDLVLTDVEMPVVDGYSAAREMRSYEKQRGCGPTPILALTAHALKEAVDRSIEAGCTGHLVKPIRKAALLEAIGRYVGEAKHFGHVEASVEPWLKPIVSGYLEKRIRDVVSLRSAIGRRDFQTVRTVGHQMAGTGASYGFTPITEIGFGLEAAAREGNADRIVACIEELERYLRAVEAG